MPRNVIFAACALATSLSFGVFFTSSSAIAAATSSYEDRCFEGDGDPEACTIFAKNLAESSDPVVAGRGGSMLALTCKALYAPACYYGGLAAKTQRAGFADWEARYSFRKACDLDHAQGCAELSYVYLTGAGVERDLAVALAVAAKSCQLGEALGCAIVDKVAPAGKNDPRWNEVPPIDPSIPAAQQMSRALPIVENRKPGDRDAAFLTIIRLMQEKDGEAEWIVSRWFERGLVPYLGADPEKALILQKNAAAKGHVEAMIEIGMRYWEGNGLPQNRELAMAYMRYASLQGSEKAWAIHRSMLREPERERMRRESLEAERLYAEWRNNPQNTATTFNTWRPSSYSGADPLAASRRNYESRVDQRNWSQAMDYTSGRSTVCLSSNPYC